jgi:hypothetical protein
MTIEYCGMVEMGNGIVRVLVCWDGVFRRITCLAHDFPNEEKGIPWLRQQFEAGKVKFGLCDWVAGGL